MVQTPYFITGAFCYATIRRDCLSCAGSLGRCRAKRLRAFIETAPFGCCLCTHWLLICQIVFRFGADSVPCITISTEQPRATVSGSAPCRALPL